MTRSPALQRLRRIRWTMTIFFALSSAVCLIALALVAAHIDTGSQSRQIDHDLETRARTYSQSVTWYQDEFHFGTLTTASLGSATRPIGFVDEHGVEVAAPDQAALPSPATIDTLVGASRRDHGIVLTTSTNAAGVAYRWAVSPMALLPTQPAAIIVGAPADPSSAHARLVQGLVVTVTGLVFLLALAGHLLSGRAMRPAIRGLQLQEQFLLEAAHELRTPLATMRVLADDGLEPGASAPVALERISHRIDGMASIIAGLTVRSRAHTGIDPIELVPLRLDQLVELTVEDMPESDRIVLDVNDDDDENVIIGNADLLAQAVRNLVENALRYGLGPVVVTVRGTTLSVSDAGPGIPESERQRAIRSGTGAGLGTGTGLAIVAWVAETHHSELVLATAAAGGLLAKLRLPTAGRRA